MNDVLLKPLDREQLLRGVQAQLLQAGSPHGLYTLFALDLGAL
jgi:hypothetical protein